jgi:hypothetical protein
MQQLQVVEVDIEEGEGENFCINFACYFVLEMFF